MSTCSPTRILAALLALTGFVPCGATSPLVLDTLLPSVKESWTAGKYSLVQEKLKPWVGPELNADKSSVAFEARYLYAAALCRDSGDSLEPRRSGYSRLQTLSADLDSESRRIATLAIKSSDAADLWFRVKSELVSCKAKLATAIENHRGLNWTAAGSPLIVDEVRGKRGPGSQSPGTDGKLLPKKLDSEDFKEVQRLQRFQVLPGHKGGAASP